MSRRKWTRAVLAAVLFPPLFIVAASGPTQAAPVDTGNLRLANSLAPTGRVTAPKAPTSRLAKTDPKLLNRTDTAQVAVAVKLDYDSVATYEGGIAGYPATSPTATGRELSGSADEKKYESRINALENTFLATLGKRVKGATVGQRLRTVYGGVALTVPANKIRDVLAIPGVVAVQEDTLRKPQTDSSPSFIGATALYPQMGGKPNAGKGVIFGVLDTGAWPEHPSLADNGNLPAPPAKADGTPRTCNFGDNPLTPASDVFACNHKLIGGAPFLATYLSDPARAAAEPYKTARDSNGHGTHTGTTAAGDPVAHAPVLGVDRGPANGIAPGAWVSVYKVCGIDGCFSTDSAAAVQQAIKDGVKVINFSISGGSSPFTDPVELAFLDAYKAGVFVSASAGNSGPGASTSDHLSPWVTTVAASTQKREFQSTLTLTGGGATLTLTGSSLTQGAGPLPVVLASAAPYSDAICSKAAPAGLFTGKIVACQRGGGIGRVQKGFNVKAGGAAGMILYNPTLQDTETDNHFLPTVHLADGTQFLAFMAAHPDTTAQFTAGVKVNGQGDVMAAFSSRGPGGNFIKPDITAPGVQILAGNTPTPDEVASGPPGEYYQAIAGTSMSSPHIAGSALLLRALHPEWTPGQVKSAIMTTATTDVVKEDLTTPADPFDFGSGRVRVNVAANPVLTFDETAENMVALGNDPVNAVHLNLPSVNAPIMPGKLTTIRTARNTTNSVQVYRAHVTAPAGSSIEVTPSTFTLLPRRSIDLTITIKSNAPTGQFFGQIRLDPTRAGLPTLHLPVAFVPRQGDVNVAQSCAPTSIAVGATSTCTVTAQNTAFGDTTANFTTTTSDNIPVVSTAGGVKIGSHKVVKNGVPLKGAVPGTPSVAPGELFGYIPLGAFGIAPTTIGDEQIVTFDVPSFKYNGVTYSSLSIDSNGYLLPGVATSEDNNCCNLLPIPNPARPNNVLAPFWTDLDGTGTPGIRVGTLTDGVDTWIVAEWDVNVFGTSDRRQFQVWLGTGATQDITFAYNLPTIADPNGQDLLVGAENVNGTGGGGLPMNTVPTADLRVTSTDPTPGASVSYTVTVKGERRGTGTVTTSVDSPAVPGTTVVTSQVMVNRAA
jgi:hypothetical protein